MGSYMNNPYNERFLKALEHLEERGKVETRTEFCNAIEIPSSYLAGFKDGSRNVHPIHISNLYVKYRVSFYYLLLGYGPIMDEERKGEPIPKGTPEELAHMVAVERARVEVLEKFLAAKDEEIAYLRAVLSKMVENKGK